MQGRNDNATAGGEFLPSRLALFLPMAMIAAGYGILLAALALSGRSGSTAFRFCAAVLALGVPFLFAHALLRQLTIRVRLLPHAVFVHRGFPSLDAVEIPYERILAQRIVRGFGGRLTGAGTLILEIDRGSRLAICDLADPETARDCIAVHVHGTRRRTRDESPALQPGQPAAATTG